MLDDGRKVVVISKKSDTNRIQIEQTALQEVRNDGSLFLLFCPSAIRQSEVLSAVDLPDCRISETPLGKIFVARRNISVSNGLRIEDRGPYQGSTNCRPFPASEAQYWFRLFSPCWSILLQEITCPEGRQFAATSAHYHKTQVEQWFVLEGRANFFSRATALPKDWERKEMQEKSAFRVLPKTEHFIATKSRIVNLLAINGAPQDNPMADHFYVNRPSAALIESF